VPSPTPSPGGRLEVPAGESHFGGLKPPGRPLLTTELLPRLGRLGFREAGGSEGRQWIPGLGVGRVPSCDPEQREGGPWS
ncbi:hypothetical protein P7K49_029122, partial [Saguinus oedipus]